MIEKNHFLFSSEQLFSFICKIFSPPPSPPTPRLQQPKTSPPLIAIFDPCTPEKILPPILGQGGGRQGGIRIFPAGGGEALFASGGGKGTGKFQKEPQKCTFKKVLEFFSKYV